jgi:hypothetical protein
MAAGSTYTPIATTTLGTATGTVTFSSISASYTDLVLVVSARLVSSGHAAVLQFNSDTGSNYSVVELYGNGSSAAGNHNENITSARLTNSLALGDTASVYAPIIANIMNYSNTNTYKTTLVRFSNANTGTAAIDNLWRSTSAINQIDIILTGSGGQYATGSTFTLYGIAAA